MSPRAGTSALEAGNALTQIDSLDLLRRVHDLTVAETEVVLHDALTALLAPKCSASGTTTTHELGQVTRVSPGSVQDQDILRRSSRVVEPRDPDQSPSTLWP